MSIPWALAVPVIIFLGIIVPMWIMFHYITVWIRLRTGHGAGAQVDSADIQRLQSAAERLERRLDSLETILDKEAPDWRHK